MNDYLGLRIDPELKKNLEYLAEQENRSLSNFVLTILKNYSVLKLKNKGRSKNGKE